MSEKAVLLVFLFASVYKVQTGANGDFLTAAMLPAAAAMSGSGLVGSHLAGIVTITISMIIPAVIFAVVGVSSFLHTILYRADRAAGIYVLCLSMMSVSRHRHYK